MRPLAQLVAPRTRRRPRRRAPRDGRGRWRRSAGRRRAGRGGTSASWRKSARSWARSDWPCSRSCSATRASWWNGAPTSSSGLMRGRSCGREAGRPHRAGEEGDGLEERAAPVVRQAGVAGLEDAGQAAPGSRRRWRSARRQSLAAREEQGEQLAEVAGRRRQRQEPGTQPGAELGPQAGARREAEVGEQRRAVDVAQEQRAAFPPPAAGDPGCAPARRAGSAGAAPASACCAARRVPRSRSARAAATRPGGSPTGGARRSRPWDRRR